MNMPSTFRLHAVCACLLAFAAQATGQVQVDRPIGLTGAEAGQQQVSGLDHSLAPGSALTAATEVSGMHRLAAVAPGEWHFTLPGLPGPPQVGTQLLVVVPSETPGPVGITLNGSGPHPLTAGPEQAVDGSELAMGAMLALVFDGTAFQLLNGSDHGRRDCPPGTVPVSGDLCVGVNEHPMGQTDFFTAILTCHADGMRLCSWSEWVIGCAVAAETGIMDMLGNWEWTDDMANEDGSANTTGGITGQGCYSAGTSGALAGSRPFRCCYRR